VAPATVILQVIRIGSEPVVDSIYFFLSIPHVSELKFAPLLRVKTMRLVLFDDTHPHFRINLWW